MSEHIKVADPLALGYGAFATTLFALSWVIAGLVPPPLLLAYVPLALFLGGIVMLLAGMWAFYACQTFNATAFSAYAAMWLAIGFLMLNLNSPALNFGPAAFAAPLLIFIPFTIFTLYVWIASFRLGALVIIFYTLLFVTLILLDLVFWGFMSPKVTGIIGIICAIAGWYVSATGLFRAVYGRNILPLGSKE